MINHSITVTYTSKILPEPRTWLAAASSAACRRPGRSPPRLGPRHELPWISWGKRWKIMSKTIGSDICSLFSRTWNVFFSWLFWDEAAFFLRKWKEMRLCAQERGDLTMKKRFVHNLQQFDFDGVLQRLGSDKKTTIARLLRSYIALVMIIIITNWANPHKPAGIIFANI